MMDNNYGMHHSPQPRFRSYASRYHSREQHQDIPGLSKQPVVYLGQGTTDFYRASSNELHQQNLRRLKRMNSHRNSWTPTDKSFRSPMVPSLAKKIQNSGPPQKRRAGHQLASTFQQKNSPVVVQPKRKSRSVAVQCLWEEGKEWPSISFVSAKNWLLQCRGFWGQSHHWSLCRSSRTIANPGFKVLTPSLAPEIPRPPIPWEKQIAQVDVEPSTNQDPQAVTRAITLRKENEALCMELKMMSSKCFNLNHALQQLVDRNQQPDNGTPVENLDKDKI